MSEIEIKIPLSDDDFLSINNFINHKKISANLEFSSSEEILKSDEYFSRYKTRAERKSNNEFEVIRIRTEKTGENQKSFFTTKRKSLVNGFEVNDEKETFVENPDVLRNFLLESGFEIWFTKKKDAISVFCNLKNHKMTFHLELEKVNELKYVEIENTSSGENQKDEIFAELEKIVAELGLDIAKNDPRSWAEIIQVRGMK